MASSGLPASYLERLRARLESCDQPLIELWGWPASGRSVLLQELAAAEPDRCRLLPGPAELAAERTAHGNQWLLLATEAPTETLLDAVSRLPRGGRLIYSSGRRRLAELLPQRTVGPGELLLRAGEIEELTSSSAAVAGRAEDLWRATDGWYGPLRWLLHRLERDGAEPLAAALASAGFRAFVERHVLAPLDPHERAVLERLARIESVAPELWRLVWRRQPERLAALERLLRERGLVAVPGDGPPRLPAPLRFAFAPGPEDASAAADLHRRLGLAAAALGRDEEAVSHLRRAGDPALAARWLELRDPESGWSRVPDPSLPTFGELGETLGFRLELLGLPAVHRVDPRGRARELAWRLRRALQTVAFLALRPDRRATRDELVEALWTDASERAVRKNFHPTLSEARRTLTGGAGVDPILYRQGAYQLNPALAWDVDCLRFERLALDGRELAESRLEAEAGGPADERLLALLRRAWRLYRGPLLADLEASWITPHRERLVREYLRLLRTLGALARRLGRDTLALDAWRSVLLEEPFEERIHLEIMELYARQGRRDLVRRQYVKLQEHLAEDLDVEPLEETQERYHELMR